MKISIRIRPTLPDETNCSSSDIIIQNDENNIILINDTKSFKSNFDKIFSASSNQKEIFNYIKKSTSFIKKEINFCIITYGQKNSGKTYTMLGGDLNTQGNKSDINLFSEANGIIPNFVIELFSMYNKKISSEIEISCNYIQLINDKIFDLLIDEKDKKETIKIKNDKINGVTIEGIKEIIANNFYNVFQLLELGQQNMVLNSNNNYSYGHTIFILNILNKKSNMKTKIKFCDLAGTNIIDYHEKDLQKTELKTAHFISTSLSSFKNVLLSITNNLNEKNTNTFIPYKDSKLTQILQDTLNNKIFIIATISSSPKDFDESLNTLQFVKKLQDNINKNNNNGEEQNDKNNQNKINKLKKMNDLKKSIKLNKKKGLALQNEISDLKKENQALKNYINLNSVNNISLVNIQKILKENKKLKDELKELTSINELNIKNSNISSATSGTKSKKLINSNNNLQTIDDYDNKIIQYKYIYDSKDKLPIINGSKSERKSNFKKNTLCSLISSSSVNKIMIKKNEKDKENLFRRNARLILMSSNNKTENKEINKTESSSLSRNLFKTNNNTERTKKLETFDDYMNNKSLKYAKPTIISVSNLNNYKATSKIKLLNDQTFSENKDEYKDLNYSNEQNYNVQNINDEQSYSNKEQNNTNEQDDNIELSNTEQNNDYNIDDEQKEESNRKYCVLKKKKTKTETNDSDNTTTQKYYITAENTNLFDESSLMHVKLNKKRLTSEDIFKLQFQRRKKQQSLDNFTKKNKIKTLNFIKGLSCGENLEIIDGRGNSEINNKNGFSFINVKNL